MRPLLPLLPLLVTGILSGGGATGTTLTPGELSLTPPCRVLISPTGEADYDRFGWSVAGAGDVNGDGYADVIVGAYAAYYGIGRAYVYYGGPNADDLPDLTFTGHLDGEAFGSCVSGAGDVNGDGYADVVVGTGFGGRAYVYYGGPRADSIADLTLTSPEPRDAFGAAVAGVGDVNGDGYDDVIIGAGASASGKGRAYLYFGGPHVDNVSDLVLAGDLAYGGFGNAITAADVNGDGYRDIIVGADGSAPNPGHVYVYHGGPTLDAVPDLTLSGEAPYTRFGVAVSSAGDVNGDGYDDVIVGAEGNFSGRAYVYFGGPNPDDVPDLTLTGTGSNDLFAFSVAGAGDVNCDGFADLLAGAAWDSAGGAFAGRAFVYYGGPAVDATADLTLTGEATFNLLGQALAGAGDVDGDGCSDIVVSAWAWAKSSTETLGRVYVISGRAALLEASVELAPRAINLSNHAPWITAYIELSGFDPTSVDVSSLRLAGSVPPESKFAIVGDHDANGVPDLMVKFERDALDPLLSPGMNRLEVTGSLLTGQRFRGADSVWVIEPGHGPPAFSIAPNPFNPSTLLRFETTRPGPARVQVFDLGGRLVRTLMDLPEMPAGRHAIRMEAGAGDGIRLGSGVYFLRIQTVEGEQAGRIVVLK